ncbi:hypothetical protein NVIE_0831 [Nitrososphaera viennensis EN76]|uniref:Uncharacterized protein n=1 Tax=Nitrososphaera viennensis EN76 TaxID=926571 RepID=A0A060HIA5_9ARCH|nr:hypothetical protein NVIE_0831 [Nitrososphaera viennensis EN76]
MMQIMDYDLIEKQVLVNCYLSAGRQYT